MTFCEYMEKMQNEPLTDFQKQWFGVMEKYMRNGCELSMPPRVGRMLSISMIYAINDWKENYMSEVAK